MGRVLLLGALAAAPAGVLVAPRAACAQTDAEKAEARRLADEGAKALKKKDYATAEARFAAAVAIVPAPTLYLELGRAQEGRGKLASAARSYEQAVAGGTAPKASPPFRQAAKDAALALALVLPRVPGVVISVKGGGGAARVRLDGEEVETGVRLARDPGTHRVVVTATGWKTATRVVDLPEAQAIRVEVTLQAEEDEEQPKPPPQPDPPQPDPPPRASAQPRPWVAPPAAPPPRGNPNTGLGVGLLVVGLAITAGGAVTTGLAVAKHDDLAANCPGGICDKSWKAAIGEYEALGWVSPFALGVGGVFALSGVILLTTGPSSTPAYAPAPPPSDARRASPPRVSVGLGPSSVGLRLAY